MRRKLCALLLALVLTQVLVVQEAFGEETVTPESLTFTVYVDGYVFVDYRVLVDSRDPSANVSVFGQAISEVLVVDSKNLPLDYSRSSLELCVNTLGVDSVRTGYFTQDLTRKDGRFWTLNVTAPINSTVVLPSDATIVDFNQDPDLIDTNNNRILVLMPAGQIELTYVVGVIGTKEYAQVVLNTAQQVIDEIESLNVQVPMAEMMLQQAWESFNAGDYAGAEALGNEAEETAIETNQTATQALAAKNSAEAEIGRAEEEGRTLGLDEAISLLEQSESAYANGNYTEALELAIECQSRAMQSTRPATTSSPVQSNQQFAINEAAILVVVAAAVSATGFLGLRFVQRTKAQKQAKKKKTLDAERIFKRNDLRREEKEAIRLIVENNGEVLEAELYSKLNLPRTTTWRLVKRLEKMGVVEVAKNRRDNVVRLKK